MTHRMKTLLMACMIAAVGQAQTVATADTLARDLSELEAIMPDSAITDNPTGDYGAPKPNDIDAMRFLTDRQHWYRGDPLRQGGGRWFLQVDGGFAAYASSPAVGLTAPTRSHAEGWPSLLARPRPASRSGRRTRFH